MISSCDLFFMHALKQDSLKINALPPFSPVYSLYLIKHLVLFGCNPKAGLSE
jgi:hypothetical protein